MKKVEINFNLTVSNGEETSFITEGTYEKLAEFVKLCFIEQTDIAARTEVYIYNNRVEIKRDGSIKMNMVYIEKEETTVNLITDFNYQLEMINFTHKLKITENNILIEYQTETDMEQNVIHCLYLMWTDLN